MNIFETGFAAYLSAKKSGQRKEVMKTLNAFLWNCEKLNLAAEREVVTEFFKRQDADDRVFEFSRGIVAENVAALERKFARKGLLVYRIENK